MKICVLIIVLLAANIIYCFSQPIIRPNHALKSHETLEITKVEITEAATVVSLTIENRIVGGNFCADRNIFLIDSEDNRYYLQKSSGIPVCPDAHKFKSIGDILQFTLTFPPLKTGTNWFDLIEDCPDNCFWFYGVTLDAELNKRLDEAFSLASSQKPDENIVLFRSILDEIGSENLGIEGLLYINIISAASENADKVNETVWYKRFASSNAPRLYQYIKYLNDRGIKH